MNESRSFIFYDLSEVEKGGRPSLPYRIVIDKKKMAKLLIQIKR